MAFDLSKKDDIKKDADSTGRSSYLWESGIYDCQIDMAYIEESRGGALGLHLTLVSDDRRLRESFYMTSGTQKGKKNYYEDRKGEKRYLPGFQKASDLCRTAVDKDLEEIANGGEKKTINVWNNAQRKEVPTEKAHVLTSLIGESVKVGVVAEIVNRQVNNGSGKYVPSNEKRTENHISQFFNAETGMTGNEMEDPDVTEASHIEKWLEDNDGVTRNSFKEVDAPPAGNSGQSRGKSVFKK